MLKSEHPSKAQIKAIVQVIAKGISGALRIAFSPILGSYSYHRGIRALGIAQGFLAGMRGEGQTSYARVTGE